MLDVPVTELAGRSPSRTRARRVPVLELDARIDEVTELLREEQEFVMKCSTASSSVRKTRRPPGEGRFTEVQRSASH